MSRPILAVLAAAVLAAAAPTAPAVQEPLRVATKESPPFAFRGADGEWIGISVDLWSELAGDLGLDYELVPVAAVDDILEGIEAGDFDAAVAAVTVTAPREERVDFSHPYFATGLGVAVRGEAGSGAWLFLRALLSWEFLTLMGSILLALLAGGVCFWFLERRSNDTFRDRKGVSQGIWWSTIMLLGHKGIYPQTNAGRLLAVSCMIVSILLLSVLTGAIASALTVGHLEVLIRDQNDLRHVQTVAVAGSSSADYLRRERIPFTMVSDVAAGLVALEEREADALVHDAPLLEYEVAARHARTLRVVPQQFELQDYAIVLPEDSPLHERVDTALLRLRADPRWEQIQYRYLRR